MKKLIFVCIILIGLSFGACSSDDSILSPTPTTPESKTYAVKFNAVGAFNSETTPIALKSGGSALENYFSNLGVTTDRLFMQYAIFDENGDLYKTVDLRDVDDLSLSITEDLPQGKYTLAMLLAARLGEITKEDLFAERWCRILHTKYLLPETGTDYYPNHTLETANLFGLSTVSPWVDYTFYRNSLRFVFFNTLELEVKDDGQKTFNVELEPMWSEIQLTIKDFATCYIPSDAQYVAISLNPICGALLVANKDEPAGYILDVPEVSRRYLVSVDDFRKKGIDIDYKDLTKNISFETGLSENFIPDYDKGQFYLRNGVPHMQMSVSFYKDKYKTGNYGEQIVLPGAQKIKEVTIYDKPLKRGQIIKLTGNLGNLAMGAGNFQVKINSLTELDEQF